MTKSWYNACLRLFCPLLSVSICTDVDPQDPDSETGINMRSMLNIAVAAPKFKGDRHRLTMITGRLHG
jgi:hypothetical protein